MSLSENDFVPQQNPIYVFSGEYKGQVSFRTDEGSFLTGEGSVQWSDTTACLVSVRLDTRSITEGLRVAHSADKFLDLRLQGEDGVFTSEEVHISGFDSSFGATASLEFRLQTLAATFDPHRKPSTPAYWVIPLLNFVTDFRSDDLTLDRHPLRVYPTPEVPSNLAGIDAYVAHSRANSRNSLIIFQWESSPCFIEGVPDQQARVQQLRSRQAASLATSVMVGAVGGRPHQSVQEVESWLPTDLITPLSLASGAYVGFPYVELRGSDGGLYRRVHISTYRHPYSPARPHIHEIFDSHSGATGALLTAFSALTPEKKRLVRIASEHLTAVAQNRSELENAYDHLVRGFEFLTKEFDTGSENLLANVAAAHTPQVLNILEQTRVDLVNLAQTIRLGGDHGSADRIERIAKRARSAAQTERSFGFAVSKLCQQFNLADEAIVNEFYLLHPRSDGNNSWAGVLSAYRGGVIHVGYLELPTSDALHDVLRYNAHLHDLLVRIILIAIGYPGTYQPVVSENFKSEPLNWVQPTTPPSALGFS